MKHQSILSGEVLCIVRSVNERTTELCRHLLEQQVDAKDVVVVQEKPFSLAVRKSFELGIKRGLPWTLCLDADVLLRQGAVRELLDYAHDMEENIFEVQAMIRDKTMGIVRAAGNHLYRTSLLTEALKLIPSEGTTLRPETETLFRMARRGKPFIQAGFIVGLHDFEQSYSDLYKKSFLQGAKFKKYFPPIYEQVIEASRQDDDFKVIKRGLEDGYYYSFFDTVYVDSDKLPHLTAELKELLGIKEKPPVEFRAFQEVPIEDRLSAIKTPERLMKLEQILKGTIDKAYVYQKPRLTGKQILYRIWLELPLPTSLRQWLKDTAKQGWHRIESSLAQSKEKMD